MGTFWEPQGVQSGTESRAAGSWQGAACKVAQSLRAKFQQDLQEYLNSDAYRAVYDQYGQVQVSEAVEEILIKNADTIFRGFLKSIMQSGFEKMRASLLSNNHY